jgi:hypothetical protein
LRGRKHVRRRVVHGGCCVGAEALREHRQLGRRLDEPAAPEAPPTPGRGRPAHVSTVRCFLFLTPIFFFGFDVRNFKVLLSISYLSTSGAKLRSFQCLCGLILLLVDGSARGCKAARHLALALLFRRARLAGGTRRIVFVVVVVVVASARGRRKRGVSPKRKTTSTSE